MPPPEQSLSHWLLGLVGAGVVSVVGLYFRGILAELRGVTGDLREVVKTLTAQDKTLALTVQRVDAHDVELERMRDRQHEQASTVQALVLRGGGAK